MMSLPAIRCECRCRSGLGVDRVRGLSSRDFSVLFCFVLFFPVGPFVGFGIDVVRGLF